MSTSLEQNPKSESAILAFANQLLQERRIESATRVLRFLQSQRSLGDIELDNDSISIPVLLARCLAAGGDLAGAMNELETAIRRDPDSSSLETRGAIPFLKGLRAVNGAKEAANEIYKKGDATGAAEAYYAAQALAVERLGEPLSVLHANAAAALVTVEKFDEAADQCRAALALHPINAKAWLRLANCLLTKKAGGGAHAALAALSVYQALSSDDAGSSKLIKQVRAKYLSEEEQEEGATFHHPNNDNEVSKLLAASQSITKESKSLTALPSLWESEKRTSSLPTSPRLVLVDVFATWCGPCKAISPVFENIAQGSGCVSYLKVDGDKCKGFCSTGGGGGGGESKNACASEGCGSKGCGSGGGSGSVRAFPTFISFLDGKEVGRFEGADPTKLNEMIKDATTSWRRSPPEISSKAAKVIKESSLTADGRSDICQLLAHALNSANVKKFEF
jgi:thioredoxin 1